MSAFVCLSACQHKDSSSVRVQFKSRCVTRKKRKDSAGSDDRASMVKGGGYVGAHTRQPPTAQTHKRKNMSPI
jgi:hypothetical protein